jgi:hypothetical protein
MTQRSRNLLKIYENETHIYYYYENAGRRITIYSAKKGVQGSLRGKLKRITQREFFNLISKQKNIKQNGTN